ncbi:hypothetical protein HC256_001249 [Beauveria bassiana]|nr:hypothetical protein HC256_001249 [Beauveria bassiana]
MPPYVLPLSCCTSLCRSCPLLVDLLVDDANPFVPDPTSSSWLLTAGTAFSYLQPRTYITTQQRPGLMRYGSLSRLDLICGSSETSRRCSEAAASVTKLPRECYMATNDDPAPEPYTFQHHIKFGKCAAVRLRQAKVDIDDA